MKNIIITASLVVVGAFGANIVISETSAAACPDGKIMTLKPWYDRLLDDNCNIKSPGNDTNAQANFIWKIALNIIEDLLQVVGYATTGYIMYGGFLIMTSNGSSDKVAHGRKTIMNAAIGLVVALSSVAVVSFISSNIGIL
jgi:hypothetical protein cdiviTM7_00607